MLDEVLIFADHLPAWCDADGLPRTWQHFLYGMKYIARESLRRQLHTAQAVRMADLNRADWTSWQNDLTMLTEVPRHG